MLTIFDFKNKKLGDFHNYDRLLLFLTAYENQNLLEDHPAFGKGYWSFAHYTPTKLQQVCIWLKPEFISAAQNKALEQGLGLVEICRGDFSLLQEIVVTPEIDVGDLKKDFCIGYCSHHQWRIVETVNAKPSKKAINAIKAVSRDGVVSLTRNGRLARKSLEGKEVTKARQQLDCRINRLRNKDKDTGFYKPSLRAGIQKGGLENG